MAQLNIRHLIISYSNGKKELTFRLFLYSLGRMYHSFWQAQAESDRIKQRNAYGPKKNAYINVCKIIIIFFIFSN